MLTSIITPNDSISKIIISDYNLTKQEIENPFFEVYKNGPIILIETKQDNNSIKEAILFSQSEYNPDIFVYTGEAIGISSEVKRGDIILPNVFFELKEEVLNTEITKDNRDSFLNNPVFLENYNIQNDYNFEDFGLRVGGISVSSLHSYDLDMVSTEKIQTAYESDIFDKFSYSFVNEAKKLFLLDKSYALLGVKGDDNKTSLTHISHIIKFLIDNLSQEDSIEVN